jgi:hypothetical protein
MGGISAGRRETVALVAPPRPCPAHADSVAQVHRPGIPLWESRTDRASARPSFRAMRLSTRLRLRYALCFVATRTSVQAAPQGFVRVSISVQLDGLRSRVRKFESCWGRLNQPFWIMPSASPGGPEPRRGTTDVITIDRHHHRLRRPPDGQVERRLGPAHPVRNLRHGTLKTSPYVAWAGPRLCRRRVYCCQWPGWLAAPPVQFSGMSWGSSSRSVRRLAPLSLVWPLRPSPLVTPASPVRLCIRTDE